MTNAGATWVDQKSVVDGNIISAQSPSTLPEYMRDYLRVLFGE
jgi:protease I